MIYGCSQPRELWFIDFNHVHVHVHVGHSVVFLSASFVGYMSCVHDEICNQKITVLHMLVFFIIILTLYMYMYM